MFTKYVSQDIRTVWWSAIEMVKEVDEEKKKRKTSGGGGSEGLEFPETGDCDRTIRVVKRKDSLLMLMLLLWREG
jgi:hypothetical protein